MVSEETVSPPTVPTATDSPETEAQITSKTADIQAAHVEPEHKQSDCESSPQDIKASESQSSIQDSLLADLETYAFQRSHSEESSLSSDSENRLQRKRPYSPSDFPGRYTGKRIRHNEHDETGKGYDKYVKSFENRFYERNKYGLAPIVVSSESSLSDYLDSGISDRSSSADERESHSRTKHGQKYHKKYYSDSSSESEDRSGSRQRRVRYKKSNRKIGERSNLIRHGIKDGPMRKEHKTRGDDERSATRKRRHSPHRGHVSTEVSARSEDTSRSRSSSRKRQHSRSRGHTSTEKRGRSRSSSCSAKSDRKKGYVPQSERRSPSCRERSRERMASGKLPYSNTSARVTSSRQSVRYSRSPTHRYQAEVATPPDMVSPFISLKHRVMVR